MAEDIASLTLRIKSSGVNEAKRGLDGISRSGATAEREFGRLSRAGQELQKSFERSRQTMALFKGALVGLGVERTIRSLADASIELQRIQSTLTQVTGSAQKAAKEFQFVSQVSNKLGLNIQQTASGYARLAASATSAGESNTALHKGFIGLADAFTVLHAPADEVNRVLIQLDQAFSLGKVQMQDLRAISNSMPSVFSDLDDAFKGTGLSVQQMLKNGGIPAELFFERFTGELANKYGPQAVNASHNLQQAMNRLDNAFFTVESSGNVQGLSQSIDSLAKTLNDPDIQSGLSTVVQGIIEITKEATQGIAEVGQFAKAVEQLNFKGMGDFLFKRTGPGYLADKLGLLGSDAPGQQTVAAAGAPGKTAAAIVPNGYVPRSTEMSLADAGIPSMANASGLLNQVIPGHSHRQQSQAAQQIQALQKQVALYGDLSNVQQAQISIANGYYGTVTPAQKQIILNLNRELDQRQQLATATQKQQLAEQQRVQEVKSLKQELATPQQQATMTLDNRLGEIGANVKDQQLKAQLTARAWDLYTNKAKGDMSQMSAFAIHAQHDIRYQLGDTLTQTLTGNFHGILDSWANMLEQMTAQAEASDLANALFGKDNGNGRKSGGLVGAAGNAIGGYLGGLFGGGISASTQTSMNDAGIGLAGLSGIGPGHAFGGSTSAHAMYPVVERGKPEMLTEGGTSYLMTGNRSGNVTPMKPITGSSDSHSGVINNITIKTDPSLQVDQSRQTNSSGGIDFEAVIRRVSKSEMLKDLGKNGDVSKFMKQKWNLQQMGNK